MPTFPRKPKTTATSKTPTPLKKPAGQTAGGQSAAFRAAQAKRTGTPGVKRAARTAKPVARAARPAGRAKPTGRPAASSARQRKVAPRRTRR